MAEQAPRNGPMGLASKLHRAHLLLSSVDIYTDAEELKAIDKCSCLGTLRPPTAATKVAFFPVATITAALIALH
eukprot:scaffold68643_cov26-Tisochrysis_lutea.AAC.1